MASLSSLMEGIFWTTVIVIIVSGVILGNMNVIYNNNINYGFNETTGSFQKISNYQNTAQQYVTGGQTNFNSVNGLTLSTSWQMITDVAGLIGSFLSGGFIYNTLNNLNLGASGFYLGVVFTALWVFTLWVFIPIFILFKTKQ